ncbi:class I SAM-dependent methyltransferase [Mangrovimonas sp. CR14]|nr:class I SAM-dependent methyltransferase [Mangrovimonas sp. CR14]
MDTYQETFETWNQIAKIYEEKFMDLSLYNDSYDAFSNNLPPMAKVLDVGCGPGNISKYLLNKKPNLEILGIDISQNMVDLANKNLPKAKFQVMDFRNLNKLNMKFQGIICGFGLPYLSLEEIDDFIQQCYDLLSEEGILYISFVPGNTKNSGFITGMNGLRVYFNYHDSNRINEILKKNLFQHIQTMEVPFNKKDDSKEIHQILIATKYIHHP